MTPYITEQQLLSKIPQDKLMHFLAGGFIAGAVGGLWGLAAAMVIGAVKEVVDPFWGGTREFLDFAATAGGGLFVFAMHWGVMWILK